VLLRKRPELASVWLFKLGFRNETIIGLGNDGCLGIAFLFITKVRAPSKFQVLSTF
jgi:hypothetical protein